MEANILCGSFMMSEINFHRISETGAALLNASSPTIEKVLKVYGKADACGIVDFCAQPFIYSDTLIRLGYEPFYPIEKHRFFGLSNKTYLALPGLVPYTRYLIYAEGFHPICHAFISTMCNKLLSKRISWEMERKFPTPPSVTLFGEELSEANLRPFLKGRLRVLAEKMLVTMVTHPLYLMTVRSIASFADKHASNQLGYMNPLECLKITLKTEGFAGLWNGVLPRLLGDFVLVSTSAVLFLSVVNSLNMLEASGTHDMEERLTIITDQAANFVAQSYSQPFKNMSEMMMVQQFSHPLGFPPFTPNCSGTYSCWSEMDPERIYQKLSIFSIYRIFNGESVIENGKKVPLRKDIWGPVYVPSDEDSMNTFPFLLSDYYQLMIFLDAIVKNDKTHAKHVRRYIGDAHSNF